MHNFILVFYIYIGGRSPSIDHIEGFKTEDKCIVQGNKMIDGFKDFNTRLYYVCIEKE